MGKTVELALVERVVAEDALLNKTVLFARREQNFIHASMIWYEAVLALARHVEQCGDCQGAVA